MVKHTQTIRRLLPTKCLSVFDHFVGLGLKGLKTARLLFIFSTRLQVSTLFNKSIMITKEAKQDLPYISISTINT